jgi:hypothetical protein
MAGASPPGVREGITIRQLGSEVVALDILDNKVHQLNETASLIWQLKHSGQPEPEIAECLVSAYEVDRETALQHVVTMVTHLQRIGLLPATTPKC